MGIKQTLKILKRFTTSPQKPRKSKPFYIISEQEASGTSKCSENDDNPMLSIIQRRRN